MKHLDKLKAWGIRNSDKLLLGCSFVAFAGACVSSWKGGAKASRIIAENSVQAAKEGDDYTALNKIKDTWKEWSIPALLYSSGVLTSVESTKINYKRAALLTSTLEASKLALTKFEEKTLETVGKNKISQIKQGLAEDEVRATPMTEENTVKTGKGDDLFFDPKSGRYFLSSLDAVEGARLRTNARLMDEMYVTLNEFYYELGLPSIDLGEMCLWDINRDRLIEIIPVGGISETGKPCIVLNYDVGPRNHA